jgi:inosose dehydratase
MKLGLSTYSLVRAIQNNEMNVLEAIDWIKENGGEHVEIVPMGFNLTENPELIDQICEKAATVGLEISNYAIGADFLKDGDDYENEIRRVMKEVEIAHRLGVKTMRHDVAWRPEEGTSINHFEKDLPKFANACQRIADYAAQYSITTNIENHGFYVQSADRVQRVIEAVDRPNFKTILDVGNFMCVDDDPVASVKKNLPYASMVHVKDFYLRPEHQNPGEGWFQTASGNYLRGAIAGQGDIDLKTILKIVKASGYDGYLSLEFEGMEDCRLGSRIGLANVRRLWDEV